MAWSGELKDVYVILAFPEKLPDDQLKTLIGRVVAKPLGTYRCVLRVLHDEQAQRVARVLSPYERRDAFQILTNLDSPHWNTIAATVLRMSPGSDDTQTNELALAVCDAIAWDEADLDFETSAPQQRFGKFAFSAARWLPTSNFAQPQSGFVDYDPHGGKVRFGWFWGRIDIILIDIASVWRHLAGICPDWRRPWRLKAPDPWPLAGAFKGLLGGLGSSYEAPKRSDPEIADWYGRFDRAALYGARTYRDLIWLAHASAFLAVFCAVWGSLLAREGWPEILTFVELAALFVIAAAVWRGSALQGRWMAWRVGAEQLRAARLCLPLFITPPHLQPRPRPTRSRHKLGAAARNADYAALIATRAIRDQGLAPLRKAPRKCNVAIAARWVRYVVNYQLKYHEKNHAKLESMETAVRGFAFLIFGLTVVFVVAHMFHFHVFGIVEHALLVTAAGPAAAAAAHGASTRLDIVHRAHLSDKTVEELRKIVESLAKYSPSYKYKDLQGVANEAAWNDIRTIAQKAAGIMSAETENWHSMLLLEAPWFA
jgi:hypothetical protein